MALIIALGLYAVCGIGLIAFSAGVFRLWRLKLQPVPLVTSHPGMSILKPLCGIDDDLQANLESHLHQEYAGPYEVIFGVEREEDAAFKVASELVRRYPN